MGDLICLTFGCSLGLLFSIMGFLNDNSRIFVNSIGMKFVWIPKGDFRMGSPESEAQRVTDEHQHKVLLTRGFYIGVFPVTQEQWETIMGNNPSEFTGDKNLPVENVSWNDCQQFIKKLCEKDKKAYRLPTEAEWEYACRAGTTGPFHFGDTISTDQANYNGTIVYGNGVKGVFRAKTTKVGSFAPNAWGLYDMHGNVWQWCQDWYDAYPDGEVWDPQGPNKGERRVVRGGGWSNVPSACRSANRAYPRPDERGSMTGFRVCFFPQ